MNPSTVCILGAGTMGAGIAQVAAMHGWTVLLRDVSQDVAQRSIDNIRKQLDRLVEKQKLTPQQRDQAASRLRASFQDSDVAACDLVLEAIVEDLDAKVKTLAPIVASQHAEGFVASNTSSLSITKLGAALNLQQRTVGMHFFNPAPILPLVEIIPGAETDAAVTDRAFRVARAWGKTPVLAKDTPGFIVNRVARPYYLEAFRILAEGWADAPLIDRAARELGGFRMGPFELTDMIGQDINTATSRSVWEQLGRPPRLAPSPLQESLAAQGDLGRKTKRGVYDYSTEPPTPAVSVPSRPLAASRELQSSIDLFVSRAVEPSTLARLKTHDSRLPAVFARILVSVINECDWAVHDGVATAADIDIALKLATGYPRGPMEWAGAIGRETCANLLKALHAAMPDGRFIPPEPSARPAGIAR